MDQVRVEFLLVLLLHFICSSPFSQKAMTMTTSSLPYADRHSLIQLEQNPHLLSYSSSCASVLTAKSLISADRSVDLSLPTSVRIVTFVRTFQARRSFILQASECSSGRSEWYLCSLERASCAEIDLIPGATVHYYEEESQRLVFSAKPSASSPSDACWLADLNSPKAAEETDDAMHVRMCQCGAFCIARSRLGSQVFSLVARANSATSDAYDVVAAPPTPPTSFGWPAIQFPALALHSFALVGRGDELVRVWRTVRLEGTSLSQVLHVESRGAELAVVRTPLVAFPSPTFAPLMLGEAARCSAPRQFTHIASPTFAALALTFVNGPTPLVRHLLPVLRELNIRATFFVQGDNILRYPDLLHLIALDGHDIGVQAMHASSLDKLSPAEMEAEIAAVLAYVLGIVGTRPCFIRPPGGVTSEELETVMRLFALSSSYPTTTIQADSSLASSMVRALDTWPARSYPARTACTRQCRGAVVELVEPQSSSSAENNGIATMLQNAIDQLHVSKGVQFVRITGQPFP